MVNILARNKQISQATVLFYANIEKGKNLQTDKCHVTDGKSPTVALPLMMDLYYRQSIIGK